jgi:hypothetical protein
VEHTTEDAQFSIDIALPQEHIAVEVRLSSVAPSSTCMATKTR